MQNMSLSQTAQRLIKSLSLSSNWSKETSLTDNISVLHVVHTYIYETVVLHSTTTLTLVLGKS